MRALLMIALLLAIHTTTATIDFKKVEELKKTAASTLHTLTDQAAIKLQTLTDQAATNLQNLKQKASTTLQQLTENASTNLKEIANNIDLEKLKKLDVLDIIPKVNKKISYKKQKFERIKSHFSGENKKIVKKIKPFPYTLEGVYPWPVVHRKIIYIYE